MVCSFFYRTIPVLFVMCIYWIYCKVTGKDQEPNDEPVLDETIELKQEIKAGDAPSKCPYHVFMAFIGFPVKPKAKKTEETELIDTPANLDKALKVE